MLKTSAILFLFAYVVVVIVSFGLEIAYKKKPLPIVVKGYRHVLLRGLIWPLVLSIAAYMFMLLNMSYED